MRGDSVQPNEKTSHASFVCGAGLTSWILEAQMELSLM